MSSADEQSPRGDIVLMPMGNRWRGDDAAGLVVLDQLRDRDALVGVRVVTGADDAMSIVNGWEGAAHVLVIDAAVSGAPAGTVHHFGDSDEPAPHLLASCSSHGLGLAEAMALGQALGRVPDRLTGWAIEAAQFDDGAALSAPVANSVHVVTDQVADCISNELTSENRDA